MSEKLLAVRWHGITGYRGHLTAWHLVRFQEPKTLCGWKIEVGSVQPPTYLPEVPSGAKLCGKCRRYGKLAEMP